MWLQIQENTCSYQESEKQGTDSPLESSVEGSLLRTPCFQTAGLENKESTGFSGFKPLGCVHLLWQPQDSNTVETIGAEFLQHSRKQVFSQPFNRSTQNPVYSNLNQFIWSSSHYPMITTPNVVLLSNSIIKTDKLTMVMLMKHEVIQKMYFTWKEVFIFFLPK